MGKFKKKHVFASKKKIKHRTDLKTVTPKKQSANLDSELIKDKLTLSDVIDLGGNKSDIELLENLTDEESYDNPDEEFDAEPIKTDEIRNMIKDLGIIKVKNEYYKEKEKDTVDTVDETSKTEKKDKKRNKYKDVVENSNEPKPRKEKNKYKVQHDEVSSTSDVQHSVIDRAENYQPRKFQLLKPGGKWFDSKFGNDPKEVTEIDRRLSSEWFTLAQKVYEDEVSLYNKRRDSDKSANNKWLKTVAASGTMKDKIASLSVQIQDAPVPNLANLNNLISMVTTKGKRECLMALDALSELFLNDLLLPDKKLRAFEEHPFSHLERLASGNRDSRDKRLLLWYFESELKKKYATFVHALENIAVDQFEATKTKALRIIFTLLSERPEQEKLLLVTLINKLGDPNHKMATKASHFLSQLVGRHPNMKHVIVLEVERIIYRPNILKKAQYYAVCFLNQMQLSLEEPDLANRLISCYFTFFKAIVKKKSKSVDSKMMSALLVGVNRAYPYAKVDKLEISEQVDTIFKTVHVANFNTGLQALMLLYHVLETEDAMSDRYYMALYRKLLDPSLATSSKQAMFLNLLYKSLVKDTSEARVKAFVKRLLQVTSYQTPTFICGALVLLSELLQVKKHLLSISQDGEDSDDEEHFVDIDPESDVDEENKSSQNEIDHPADPRAKFKFGASWVHRNDFNKKRPDKYDPVLRNPLYCNADRDIVWEIIKLSHHYHPSVVLFAQTVLKGAKIVYSGDPLNDFSLIRFLDRFVFRNPKKKEGGGTTAMKRKKIELPLSSVRNIPVNSEEYLQLKEESIPVEEKFFYKFYSRKAKAAEADEESDASVNDDEFDEFLDKFEEGYDAGGDDFKGDLDFADEFGKSSKKKVKKSKKVESESEDERGSDDFGDSDIQESDDSEVDFGDDYEKEFQSGSEIDYEGFPEPVDVEGDDDEEDEDDEEGKNYDGEDEFDEEAVAFSDEDGLGEVDFSSSHKTKKKGEKRKKETDLFQSSIKKSKKSKDPMSIFESAEQFSSILDEHGESGIDTVTSEAVMQGKGKKADAKQLKWEQKREQWLKGNDWKTKKKRGGKKGPFKNKKFQPKKSEKRKR